MKRLPRKFTAFLLVLPMLLGFDVWTKQTVENTLPVGGEIPVVPGLLSWFHAQNPDVAFSLQVPLPVVVVAGIVGLCAIAVLLWKLPAADRVRAAALASIAAGAVGNLIDRIGDGSVTDFVRVYTDDPRLAPWLIETFGTATWPIFNVADAALLCGVGTWLVADLVRKDEPELEVEPG